MFDTLTQTFVENEHGTFNAHHYRHSPRMSTFVVECDAATWERAGFAAMDEAATLAYLEKVFGHPLVSNKSVWRNFPNLRNQRWSVGNVVLIGDALRTAHFSIGSGTRLAMEDAIALNQGAAEEPSLEDALAAFEAARRPIVDKLLAAADASGAWYERFPEHMKLAPREFAWSYIQRSGRIDPARLRKISPKFVDGNVRPLFPTTLVGSYPQPEWLIDREKLAGRFPPRVRATSSGGFRSLSRGGAGRRDAARDPRAGGGRARHHHRRRDPARELLQPLRHRARGRGHRQPGQRARPLGPSEPGAAHRRAGSAASTRSKSRTCCSSQEEHGKPVKMTVPGPFTMSQQAQNDFYKSRKKRRWTTPPR